MNRIQKRFKKLFIFKKLFFSNYKIQTRKKFFVEK